MDKRRLAVCVYSVGKLAGSLDRVLRSCQLVKNAGRDSRLCMCVAVPAAATGRGKKGALP